MREKVLQHHRAEVIYDTEHWELLAAKRDVALTVMERLGDLAPQVYGSVARGDVHRGSDIDIIVPRPIPSLEVESRLEVTRREVVAATPWLTPKAHYHLDPEVTVTHPLWHPTPAEEGFHRFDGALDLPALRTDMRVAGVDKRLVLVTPTSKGHTEEAVQEVGPSQVARALDIPLAVVEERVSVLVRRDAIGRTGVFLRRELAPDESVEAVAREVQPRFQRRR